MCIWLGTLVSIFVIATNAYYILVVRGTKSMLRALSIFVVIGIGFIHTNILPITTSSHENIYVRPFILIMLIIIGLEALCDVLIASYSLGVDKHNKKILEKMGRQV